MVKMKTRQRKRQKGFSIIELLVAMGILGSLAVMVFTMMNSSSGMYSRTSADSALQSESQIVANTINDVLIDCKEVLKPADASKYITNFSRTTSLGDTETITPDMGNGKSVAVKTTNSNGSVTLSRVVYAPTNKKLYLVTGKLDEFGTESDQAVSLLAEYVTDFNVDISRFEKERLVSYDISMDKRGVKYQGDYQVYVRNQEVELAEGHKEDNEPNLKKVTLDPPRVYVDIKNNKVSGDYYKSNPTSDADPKFSININDPEISYSAFAEGSIAEANRTYEWKVSNTAGWANIAGNGSGAILTMDRDGYGPASATGYTVSVRVTGTYTKDGADKSVSVSTTGNIYLRMCRSVSLKQVVNPNFVKWDPIYEDTPYNGHASTEAEYYLMPGKTVSFTASPDLVNVLYKNGVVWKLESKNYTDTSWKVVTDSSVASFSNPGTNQKINTVRLGTNVSNEMLFRVTAYSEFDNSKYGEYIFGVLPSGRNNSSVGDYSRGYYADLSSMFYGKKLPNANGANDNIQDILFVRVTKVDGAGEQGRSEDKVKIKIDADGHFRVMVDYEAFAYSGKQKATLYGDGVKIHLTIGYRSKDDTTKYCIDGQAADTYLHEFATLVGKSDSDIKKTTGDPTYILGAVTVTKEAPKNDVIVLEKGASKNVTVNTNYYNLRAPRNGVYYFGTYLGTSASDMTNNLLEAGKGDLNAYFSVRMATAYGEVDDYVDQGTVTLTAKSSQSKYMTDPIIMRLTADDFYKIDPGNLENSFTYYNVVIANVEGMGVYFPSKESASDLSGLQWPSNVETSSSSKKRSISGINTAGEAVTGQVYKNGNYYILEYGSKKYQFNTAYKYWKALS